MNENIIKSVVMCRDCGEMMKRATAISWYCTECHIIAELEYREASRVVALKAEPEVEE